MLSWRQFVTYVLLTSSCLYGSAWLNDFLFQQNMPAVGRGLCVLMLMLGVYPFLLWKRDSAWVRIIQFRTWLLLSVGAGVFLTIVRTMTSALAQHYGGYTP